jgi:hypothetical protein
LVWKNNGGYQLHFFNCFSFKGPGRLHLMLLSAVNGLDIMGDKIHRLAARYVYHAAINRSAFVVADLVVLAAALTTIGFYAMKAAVTKPVNARKA